MTDQTPGRAPDASATMRMPRVGPAIASGSRVVVRVSQGPSPIAPSAYVAVPPVIGEAQGDALTALQDLGLPVEVLNDVSDSVARGRVIGQLPHAGESVAAGTEAVLIVSSGRSSTPTAPVGLPIVVGMNEQQAVAALQQSGLAPKVVKGFSANVSEGTVIDQFPSAASLAETPPKKKSLMWLWILIAALVVLGIGLFAYMAMGGKTATVPNVVGMSQTDAQAAITAAGFKVGAVDSTQTVSSADVGKVVAETPAPGTTAKQGTNINIVVSGGQKLTSVPAVTGMTQAAAEAALTAAGLTSGVTNGASNVVPKGSVVSQAPAAGQQVPAGTSVGLVVSTGAGSVAVPSVVGQSQADAQAALKAAGLGAKSTTAYNSATAGNVYGQTPAAGVLVAPGSIVTIQISQGPQPPPSQVTVPDVIGQTAADAKTAITDLGLKVAVSQSGTSTTVGAQTPVGGTKVNKGSTVNIVVNKP